MFVAVFYWVLTVFFLVVYITMTYTRIPQVPWTTVEVLRGELGRHRSEKGHGHRQRQSASHGTAGLPAAARERERTGPADVLVLDSSGPKTASRACVSMEVPSSCTSRPPWWMRPPSRLRGTVTTSTAGRPPRFLPSWSPSATLETRISVL
ncbi:CKLF-like MARVEL transmembrane domain-containing protein 8 isoform X2 [Dasypus novemcinctus]|uniref:CKLF-like MARVEL transmembrane domain-containing protein 8 isoform X2 n=1 Tax=Dasypus novemcinctus TaxID=9361 RepID=UPI00265DA012|nr:CKLF-like MARVEL transmembrane domain-containing protein 8 isoform X3 [Dasypus novemcinctus]XP_058146742.1 CKLF-like MARVEL transmembrane domain-containing protein 8 isoform X3 [Dasypus novemcinctus]